MIISWTPCKCRMRCICTSYLRYGHDSSSTLTRTFLDSFYNQCTIHERNVSWWNIHWFLLQSFYSRFETVCVHSTQSSVSCSHSLKHYICFRTSDFTDYQIIRPMSNTCLYQIIHSNFTFTAQTKSTSRNQGKPVIMIYVNLCNIFN